MLEAFLEAPGLESLTSLRRVVASGEALTAQLIRRFFARLGVSGVELHNLYGPTEASVDVSFWPCVPAPPRSVVPIGRPIANHRLHVVDRSLGAQPVGVAGELLLGGPGLARGYLGRPDLTAAVFIPDPFGVEPGDRLYRTGDLVRQLADGNVQFLGRLDHQVKIRGFRIELGEIEAALERQPGVREAVVLMREDAPGDKRLVAYLVGAAPPDLAAALGRELPEYMVPAGVVILESLPLTANGKVDRRALSRIVPAAAAEEARFTPPQGPVEEALAEIFAGILRVERVAADANFFALGGHSLKAAQVASRVYAAFGVEMPLRTLFEAPTVAALAARIGRDGHGTQAPPEAPAVAALPTAGEPRGGGLPLSFAQQRLWFLDQLAPGSPVYNLPMEVALRGRLDAAVLTGAFGEVVRRHEALRTTFRTVAGEAVQVIAPHADGLGLPVIDLRSLPAGQREREASCLRAAEAQRPFDLGQGPLLRTSLLRLGTRHHKILLTLHHIVSDGWSMGVLVREVGALYAALLAGAPSPLPELSTQYAGFAAWQRRHLSGEYLESELAWWREQLAGMPPALELPADRPRPAVFSGRGAEHTFTIAAASLAGLTAFSRRHGATLFMTVLAGFLGLLQRSTGEDDLAVGTPVAGRTRLGIEPLIGLFVNTLVMRSDLAGDPETLTLLDRVRETTLSAWAHQEVPFERLVEELAPERDLSRSPLVQVLFVLQNAPLDPLELPGLELEAAPVPAGTAKFDLTCTLVETTRGLEGSLEYSRDLYDGTTVERLAAHFTRLLAAAVAAPRQRLSELPLLSAAELHQATREWSDTSNAQGDWEGLCVAELLAAQAARTPGGTAFTCGEESLTHAELHRRANRLAHRLRRMGVGPEARVGILLERSVEMVVALLAILKAGGAYVPLDPGFPVERLAWMAADARLAVLLTAESLLARS